MIDEAKKQAAEKAIEFVGDGQIVGLGTGSTSKFAIEGLARRVKEGLKIKGVATSIATERMAGDLGIPITGLNEVTSIDIVIDGADEIDGRFDMIKGGGGALTREKLVALSARRRVYIVDESKLVQTLGAKWSVPVEVLPFAWRFSAAQLEALNCVPRLRMKGDVAYETDNGNYILDCAFGPIADAPGLERSVKLLPGVVEVGLFIGIAEILIIGGEQVVVREKS